MPMASFHPRIERGITRTIHPIFLFYPRASCGVEREPDLSVPCCSGDNRLCDARDHATTVDVCVGALVVL